MSRPALSLPFRADAVRETRERKGLTIGQLAERCTEQGHKVHRSAIGKVERGVNGPSVGLLKALAQALEVDVDQFLDTTAVGSK